MIRSRGNGIPGNEKPGRAERQDRMERNEMVMGVLDAYDRIERLEAENEKLKAGMVKSLAKSTESDPFEGINARILQVGREKLAADSLDYWKDVRVERKGGVVVAESFEDWLKRRIEKVPSFMSYEQFTHLCKAELRSIYESEKKKAIDYIMKSEQDDEE
jgi:hypothetical protein